MIKYLCWQNAELAIIETGGSYLWALRIKEVVLKVGNFGAC
jgi:hypothetical protein